MIESIKGKKLNKGEWAEFYVMMKLLLGARIYGNHNGVVCQGSIN